MGNIENSVFIKTPIGYIEAEILGTEKNPYIAVSWNGYILTDIQYKDEEKGIKIRTTPFVGELMPNEDYKEWHEALLPASKMYCKYENSKEEN